METGNYLPISVAEKLEKQAFNVWLGAVAVSAIWVLLILSPVFMPSIGLESVSHKIFGYFGFACHQIADRSFHLAGHQFAVCSRCFGIYAGILVGFLAYPAWHRISDIEAPPRYWLFLSLIPITIDWSLTIFGIWDNNHFTRVMTGGILGFACAVYLMPALVEIRRNLYLRNHRSHA